MREETKAIVFIPLTRGKVAVIDFDDFEKVRPYKWFATKSRHNWYATRTDGSHIRLHRFLLDAPPEKQVDHENGDGLINQRYNLRLCTNAQNNQARKRKRAGAWSKFRGVTWDKRDTIWMARIGAAEKAIHLGSFKNEEDAARAYDKKAKELYGEFAQLNFP